MAVTVGVHPAHGGKGGFRALLRAFSKKGEQAQQDKALVNI